MEKINIDSILIKDRTRIDFGEEAELMQSISDKGLLYPIIVQKDLTLVDGERRYRACKALGWTSIPVIYMDDLPFIERKLLEYTTNAQRKDFTWQEECAIVYEIHKAKMKECDGWNTTKTASLIGISQPSMSIIMQLIEGTKKNPEIASLGTKKEAFNKAKELEKREILREIHALTEEVKKNDITFTMYNGLSQDILQEIPDNYVDAIITDPPYGIGIEKSAMALHSPLYEDDKDKIFEMLDSVMKEFYRIMKENASGWLWYHIAYHTTIKNLLEKNGFTVYPIPLIWHKSVSPNAQALRHTYEACFLFSRLPTCKTFTTPASIQTFTSLSGTDKYHPLEKPFDLLKVLIEAITVEGDVVLDAFCGAGSIPVALLKLRRRAIGIEQDEGYYLMAKMRCEECVDAE